VKTSKSNQNYTFFGNPQVDVTSDLPAKVHLSIFLRKSKGLLEAIKSNSKTSKQHASSQESFAIEKVPNLGFFIDE
jgi:ribosome-binding factor A